MTRTRRRRGWSNPEYIVERNSYGEVVRNHKDRSTTPHVLTSPVKCRKDWEELKGRLQVNDRRGVTFGSVLDFSKMKSLDEGLAEVDASERQGRYLVYGVLVGFDLAQRYVGMEDLLCAIACEPEWVKEMFSTSARFTIEMFEYMVSRGYRFDGVWLFDDLGYRNATLFSPQAYRSLLFDADKLLCDYFHSRGMKIILHSCGNVNEFVPLFIQAGIDCLQPLEVKAGMDLIALKKKYGDSMAFMGGIDTRLYSSENPALIEKEIETKLEIAKQGGGYLYHSDHSVPHQVSFSQYKTVMDCVMKYGNY